MYLKKFHDLLWALPILVLLFHTSNGLAQCPETKSATYSMLQLGLPTLKKLELADFLVDPSKANLYTNIELSQDHFKCIDLGIHEITITGLDTLGQPFGCTEFLWVYDSVFLCNNFILNPKAIGGRIITELNEPLADVTVGLQGMTNNYFKGSNESGVFLFDEFDADNFVLQPVKEDGLRNGISTMDVLFLQKHILGLRKLKSPYKLIAADINNSGGVTAFDMVLLRQLILSSIDAFPNNRPWRFVDANFEFTDPTNPFLDKFPESFEIAVNAAPQLDNRFIAIKVGDLNNTVNLEIAAGIAAERVAKVQSPINFYANQPTFQKGEEVTIELKLETNRVVEGAQFSLNFDDNHLDFIGIESDLLIAEDNYALDKNELKFSWTTPEGVKIYADESPLKLRFRAKENGQLADGISLETEFLPAEIYIENEVILPIGIKIEKEIALQDFKAYDNFPNPFSNSTNLPFYLPKNSEVNLAVFNTNGQLIYQKNQTFPAGMHSFKIENVLQEAGIYFYQLKSDLGTVTRKMNYLMK